MDINYEETIPELIEQHFKAKTLEIKRINEGYSHFMYNVKINKEPFEVIIRFSNNKKTSVSLEKEDFIIKTLRNNKIPAPKIYASTKDYMTLEKFNGERLDLIWEKLPKNEKIAITIRLCKLLKDIHSIEFDRFGRIGPNGRIESDKPFKFREEKNKIDYNLWCREFLKNFFEDLARISSYNHINKKLILKIIYRITSNLKRLAYNGTPRLIHGDYQKGHVFVKKINNEYRIIGLIDFEFANAFAPEYDFIKLHREGFFTEKYLKKALEQGYGKINQKAVELYRLSRDLGFAWAVLEAGNKKLSDRVLRNIEKKLKE